ncbi:MAG: hypothetical protein PVJ39_00695 [Gammaproteobacteria bacterium]|jgi:hypothetical protein
MPYQIKNPLAVLGRIIAVGVLVSSVNACSTVSMVNEDAATQASNIEKNPASVSGFVVDTDGVTPIYGATVAVVSTDTADAKTFRGDSDHCATPAEPHQSYTCTREDGSFTVNISAASEFPVTVRIENGSNTHEITINRDDVNSDLGVVVMSQQTVANKDKVAVVMDFYNPVDQIKEFLDDNPSQLQSVKLQLMNEYESLYQISSDKQDVSYPTFYSLFIDGDKNGKPDIFNYDVVYINSRDESDIAQLDESIRKQLLAFINNGGQLYVTEWTVEMEQEEPGADQYI